MKALYLILFFALCACSCTTGRSTKILVIPASPDVNICFTRKDRLLLADQVRSSVKDKQVVKKFHLKPYWQSECNGLYIIEGYLQTERTNILVPVLKSDSLMVANIYAYNGIFDAVRDSLTMNGVLDEFFTINTVFNEEEMENIIRVFKLGVHFGTRVRVHYEY